MGFISQNNKVVLSAFLTQKGRENMINGSLEDFQVKYYAMSDPDVNYLIESNLSSGFIPDLSGGHKGQVKSLSSGVEQRYTISGGANVSQIEGLGKPFLKSVEGNSTFQKTLVSIPDKTITSDNLRIIYCQASDLSSPFGNLLSSFNFPITQEQKEDYQAKYKNTALASFININEFAVIEVGCETYGEMIDGKTIELNIPLTDGGNMVVHSTYFGYNKDLNKQLSDSNSFSDEFGSTPSPETDFNSNIAFLFSNVISKPKDKVVKKTLINKDVEVGAFAAQTLEIELETNKIYDINLDAISNKVQLMVRVSESDVTIPFANAVEMVTKTSFKPLFPSKMIIVQNTSTTTATTSIEVSVLEASSNKSWSKWTNEYKFPVEKNGFGKAVASFQDEEFGLCIDEPVGIAYLDKGLIVLTHPEILSKIDTTSEKITMSFKSVVTEFSQTITCVALPEEFYCSNNPTFKFGHPEGLSHNDFVYITEIGLYNASGQLIAIAKTSEPVKKNKLNVTLFSVKLKL
jgi:hypothetical protein